MNRRKQSETNTIYGVNDFDDLFKCPHVGKTIYEKAYYEWAKKLENKRRRHADACAVIPLVTALLFFSALGLICFIFGY